VRISDRREAIFFKTARRQVGDNGRMSTMSTADLPPRAELRSALTDIAPALVAAVPMGLLFGAVAVAKGMAPPEAALMSALVFAGGAQFAAIELWQHPPPLLALVVSTALINARHILMGLSLAPKLAALGPLQRLCGCAVMADENWALAERRASRQPLTPAYFLGMGAVFWANWVFWSTIGAMLGPVLGDPRRFGADFAFVAIFIGLVVALSKGARSAGVVAASALAATLAHALVGSPWHVLSGAFAGIVAAALLYREDAR
jgi:4-azaleucine resistance transporter AzlC